ncbi:pyrroline-5-carboxylate reductase [Entomomonas asaccharolytica]|uniref:Pyrroline-5-carboxylate reductase n=1 Tax=Entomomonas asaccharolytica TaxID=2785331 RepID=A0A974NH05_9GAMM|nr:pyrroline-5-carboxylate reductase [Entomomonas asaccharolytica]QQP86561.1 pyrroline-5-carboxylate reductase [Entomomonas asaccharolytica]
MNKKIGFIGAGNMGGAIIGGLVESEVLPADHIYAINHHPKRTQELVDQFAIKAASSIEELVKASDIVLIAVKPKTVAEVLAEAAPFLKKDVIIISVAAGVTLASLEKAVGSKQKLVRIMPNLPSLVGEGASSITPNELVSEEDLAIVKEIFNSFGKAEVVSEDLIHAVVGVSGSSPAYVFMFIEALADAAVQGGMSREQACTFAAQSVLGSAKMVLETGINPGALKDMICSPGGTTIEAVCELERKGFRSAVIDGVQAAMAKSAAMSEKQ